MKVTVRVIELAKLRVDGLVLGVYQGGKLDGPGTMLDRAHRGRGELARVIKRARFDGECGQARLTDLAGTRVALAGLGAKRDVDGNRIRRAAAVGFKKLDDDGAQTIGCAPLGLDGLDVATAAQATVEGILLASYQWDCYKSGAKKKSDRRARTLTLVAANAREQKAIAPAISVGRVIAEAVATARDLANMPGSDGDAAYLAAAARRIARRAGLKCTVLNEAQLKKSGMGAFLSVARGSAKPPRFIILEHRPRQAAAPPVVLVGKGITFDTGGISLKPSAGMDEMRFDKSGGCAVLGALEAAGRLKLPLRVVGLVPACENMPGGNATRPGDIVTSLSGKSIEILNTDAEGRLILADALTYAGRYKPAAVIDLATLTGACMVALGKVAAGAYFNDEKLARRVMAASEISGEKLWRLPLWDEYKREMNGVHADLRNAGPTRYGGANTAAAFLWNFAEDYPWCHLDIAPTAWGDGGDLGPKGATGFGVRLLVQMLRNWQT